MAFEIDGYDVAELIGFGGSGEVWRAREHATGDTVALKRLRVGADLAARDRLRREAALLAGLAGPHVLRLRDLVLTQSGPVLVLDHAAGGSLAGVLAAGGPLQLGELLTVGLPLARTLADLHARGVVHGDLTPSNVLFTADGRPLLADLGVARLLGECAAGVLGTEGYLAPELAAGAQPSPSSDVYALAVVLAEAATGRPASADALVDVLPPAVTRCLVSCLAPDPAARPSAGELGAQLRELGPAQPVRLPALPVPQPRGLAVTTVVTPGSASTPAPPRRARRLPLPGGRMVAIAALTIGLVIGAVLLGVTWGARSSAEAVVAAAAPPTQPSVHWAAVMTELDTRRDDAFAAGDPSALAAVYTPGSAVLAAEQRTLAKLLDRRLVVRGLELQLLGVRPVTARADGALLEVRDRLAGYDLLDGAGRLVARRPPRAEQTWRVELRRVGREWRIAAITPA